MAIKNVIDKTVSQKKRFFLYQKYPGTPHQNRNKLYINEPTQARSNIYCCQA